MHPFRVAIEARDLDALTGLLSDDVEFRSPAVFRPYQGREAVMTVLRAAIRVFDDFRYVREIGAPESPEHALVFTARVGDRDVEGCDFVRLDEQGRVDELVVMVRPMSGLIALASAMGAELGGPPGE
ncbi:nuclear transport factor 2 family protein [Solicola gregarius]|uniref:Nuclear transport factor 2 family protein n=1 Tax=Solicola gregarius TaxID=2908642 RepID=A0AA46TH85_9ACTN|nr:nuclear transport factor 2 family protein [Solicola gregarius]UYM05317.1 nuclear transport factor 2 family protein [Solicola gregarius]